MSEVIQQFVGQGAWNRNLGTQQLEFTGTGQYGHVPDHRVWAQETPHVSGFVIPRVIRGPRGFQDLAEPERWYAALKTLIERRSRQIEGLDSTVEVTTIETPWGNGNEQFEVDTRVTRARSNVTHNFGPDLDGLPILSFIDGWIFNLIRNPDTQYADVTTFDVPGTLDMSADYKSAMILYFEPDRSMRKVIKAWLRFNVYPKRGITNQGKSDKLSGGEFIEATLETTGITITNAGVVRLAQRFLNRMPLAGSSTLLAPSIVDDVAADLQRARSGDVDNIERAVREASAV